ncbi:MAG: proton-conducting transporter membrane subunit, partial [Pseudomonadota bacterium]
LFFAAGSIYTAAHLTEIPQLRGIGRRMPWTMTAFAIGAVSMIGLPPTAGFLGKWFMLSGAASTGQWLAVAVICLSTVLNAAYFLPIVHSAFLQAPADRVADGAGVADDPPHDEAPHGEAPWPIVLALSITAALTLILFFFPDVPLELAQQMLKGGAP